MEKSLDQIRVASPCSADWDKMRGSGDVRFCHLCDKNVFNLSGMSRRDASDLVNNGEGSICVRFYRRADSTLMTEDCPVGLRAIKRRVSRIAGAIFSAFVTLLPPAAAYGFQGSLVLRTQGGTYTLVRTIDKQNPEIATCTLKGIVNDEGGSPIANAQVSLTNTGTNESLIIFSAADGTWIFKDIPPGEYKLQIVSKPAFKVFTKAEISIKAKDILQLDAALDFENKTMGVLLMAN